MSGVVLGCEMTYSSTDAGYSTCQCSNEGVTPGAQVLAYKTEHERWPDGRLRSCSFENEDSPTAVATTDQHGQYQMRLPEGVYNLYQTASCVDSYPPGYPFYYSCEEVSGDLVLDINPCWGIGCLPNVYLYPSTPASLSVSLAPGPGAALLTQFPAFDQENHWEVYVEPGGRILQSQTGFLFYEVRVGQPVRPRKGWIIPAHGFREWAEDTLPQLGWPERPQRDFIGSWISRLDRSYPIAMYLIPQQWVDARVGLHIDPPPDRVVRHWFLVERAIHGARMLSRPLIMIANPPSTLTVLEWGVIDHLPKKSGDATQ